MEAMFALESTTLQLLMSAVVTDAVAPAPASSENVTDSLLLLKAAVDPEGSLTSWVPGTDYCTWKGVQCDASKAPVSL